MSFTSCWTVPSDPQSRAASRRYAQYRFFLMKVKQLGSSVCFQSNQRRERADYLLVFAHDLIDSVSLLLHREQRPICDSRIQCLSPDWWLGGSPTVLLSQEKPTRLRRNGQSRLASTAIGPETLSTASSHHGQAVTPLRCTLQAHVTSPKWRLLSCLFFIFWPHIL
jgi:hypothetical protein